MTPSFAWNVDPVLFHLGSLSVRYYGICFAFAILAGYFWWQRRVRHFGESQEFAEAWNWTDAAAVAIGGRLVSCFFYNPHVYFAQPWRVLYLWEGGLASHGAVLGLAFALWSFSRRTHVSWTRLLDYMAPAAVLAVGWIRIGNFFNSEGVGRPTDVPWAVVFSRVDQLPRHPAQLYDLLAGIFTWLVVQRVERRNIRPVGSGFVAAVALSMYFALRIVVEYFKDDSVDQARTIIQFGAAERLFGTGFHTGQWLSIIPVVAGAVFAVRALKTTARDVPLRESSTA